MLQNFFQGSWRPKLAGLAYIIWEIYHEGCLATGTQAVGGRNVVKALILGAALYCVRDAKKSSEDEGLKPDSLTGDAVKKIVTDVMFGGTPKALIAFALVASLACSSAYAINVGVNQPEVAPNAVNVHDNANVTVPKDMVHGETGMIRVDTPMTATAQPGSFLATGTLNVPWHAVEATATCTAPLINFSAPPHMVDGQVTLAKDSFHVENINVRLMDKDAAHEIAEGLKALAAPLSDVRNIATDATNDAKHYAQYFASACGGISVIGGVCWILHIRKLKAEHAKQIAALKPKGETQ